MMMTTTIMRPHAAARRVCLERRDAENVVIVRSQVA
jgi:hypothetical protein